MPINLISKEKKLNIKNKIVPILGLFGVILVLIVLKVNKSSGSELQNTILDNWKKNSYLSIDKLLSSTLLTACVVPSYGDSIPSENINSEQINNFLKTNHYVFDEGSWGLVVQYKNGSI